MNKKPKKINPFKPIRIKPMHYKLDTDRDGVPDWNDCQPFNPWKQDKDPGDWLETNEPKPTEYGEYRDWLTTKRYKRRPKVARYDFSAMEFNAMKRYVNWRQAEYDILESVIAYIAPFKGIEPGYKSYINPKDIKVYIKLDDTLEVYDKNTRVYHFVDVTDIENFPPNIFYSITTEDRKVVGEKKLLKYLRNI